MNQIKKRLRHRMYKILKQMSATSQLKQNDLDDIRRSCSLLKEVKMEDITDLETSSNNSFFMRKYDFEVE